MTRGNGVRLRMLRREIVRDGARRGDGGNRVLEDELIAAVGFYHHGKLVEALDARVELPPIDQVQRHRQSIATRVIQEGVLNVLLRRGRSAWFRYLGHQGASPRERTPREASTPST